MKKIIIIFISVICTWTMYSQDFAIKNNLIYDATLTPNLAIEFGMGKKFTMDITGGYNPFEFNDYKKFKHWLVQPEFRYWTCERFNGWFFGLHAHGGEFNIAGLELPFGIFPALKDHRYEGYFVGGGLSFGYQWMLGRRWNLEASLGAGYAYINYDEYWCAECSPLLRKGPYHYWGITRATLSFVYFIF